MCMEQGLNLPESGCCRHRCHEKCERQWRRTLVASSSKCAHCQADFETAWTNDYIEEVDQFMAECRRMLSILKHYVLYLM